MRRLIVSCARSPRCWLIALLLGLGWSSLHLYTKSKQGGLLVFDAIENRELPVERGLSAEYERLWHRVYANTQDFWSYLNNELSAALKNGTDTTRLKVMLRELETRKSSLLADQQRLHSADERGAERAAAARDVSARLQRRLRTLQHPPHCRAARKILCDLRWCGLGCEIHQVAYCLVFALATRRVLVLHSPGWHYSPGGWESVFHPLSDTCTDVFNDTIININTIPTENWQNLSDVRVLKLPLYMGYLKMFPKFLPPAVPEDLENRISKFTGDPEAWWLGQLLLYIFRLKPEIMNFINDEAVAINYSHPIVGIQVRRTDKLIREAKLHNLSEYMAHVEEHWRQQALRGTPPPRRVYLATDEPKVLEEARSTYKNVTWLDSGGAGYSGTEARYPRSALLALLADIVMLSRADFLVCTFSSNICRLAYELMLTRVHNATESVVSIDDVYSYSDSIRAIRRVVIPHEPNSPKEIALKVDDLVMQAARDNNNGYGHGTNSRTKQPPTALTGSPGKWPAQRALRQIHLSNEPKGVHEWDRTSA